MHLSLSFITLPKLLIHDQFYSALWLCHRILNEIVKSEIVFFYSTERNSKKGEESKVYIHGNYKVRKLMTDFHCKLLNFHLVILRSLLAEFSPFKFIFYRSSSLFMCLIEIIVYLNSVIHKFVFFLLHCFPLISI